MTILTDFLFGGTLELEFHIGLPKLMRKILDPKRLDKEPIHAGRNRMIMIPGH